MSVGVVGAETGVCWWLLGHRLADVVLVLVLGVVTMAVRFGYAASLVTSALSVASLDYFFTAPYLSFAVDDRRHLLTFLILGFVAAVISNQTERIRRAAATGVRLALDRARLAEEAQRASAEAQTERVRSALLSSVSHDLRTPLAVIKGAATALLQGDGLTSPESRREHLETISGEASRLNQLVQNLLDMTSLESGVIRVRKEWQLFEEVIGVALGALDSLLGTRPVKVHIADDAASAAFDAILIGQVLTNLVENAVKYTPPGGAIELTTRRVAGGVEVEVSDSGPGVPPGQEEAIFDKFCRAGAPGIGLGLGLTICRGIVVVHGGRIECTNRASGGASFRFFLPDVNS